MGPLINAFNKNISSKILGTDYVKIGKDVAFFMIKGAYIKNMKPLTVAIPKIKSF